LRQVQGYQSWLDDDGLQVASEGIEIGLLYCSADTFRPTSSAIPAILGHEDAHSDGRMKRYFESDGGLALVVSDDDDWTMALRSSSMRHGDTWSGLCVELFGGDAIDLVEDGLLDGVARNDCETTRIFFLFCDSVTTAVWVGVWRGGQWVEGLRG
jgi:hypothetical protein